MLMGFLAVWVEISLALVPLRPQPSHVTQSATRPTFGDPLRLHQWQPAASTSPPTGALVGASLPLLIGGSAAHADSSLAGFSEALTPQNFQPVCPASDGFYRFAQTLVVGVVGQDAVREYSPLIAGGLLRVRLELCVVESFFYEAIIPFIKENGVSWVLPLHETVETFLAGTIFAVASNFILIGSTKIITVIFTYADFVLGFPFRAIGGIGWRALEDRAIAGQVKEEDEKKRPWWRGKPPRVAPPLDEVIAANSATAQDKASLVFWGLLLGLGQVTGSVRTAVEAADLFVGRYLLLTTVGYVGIKFVHFKVFDPIPF